MDSKLKAKFRELLLNRDIDRALAFLELVETHGGNYTDSQRKGAWKYMELRAEQLNDAGLDIRKVMKPTFNIPWTKDNVHDLLWIPIQKALFGTTSMRALKKLQVTKVHAVIERELAQSFGVDIIPFPSEETNLAGVRLGAMNNLSAKDYPEYNGAPTI
jgi:hypothetical protein